MYRFSGLGLEDLTTELVKYLWAPVTGLRNRLVLMYYLRRARAKVI